MNDFERVNAMLEATHRLMEAVTDENSSEAMKLSIGAMRLYEMRAIAAYAAEREAPDRRYLQVLDAGIVVAQEQFVKAGADYMAKMKAQVARLAREGKLP